MSCKERGFRACKCLSDSQSGPGSFEDWIGQKFLAILHSPSTPFHLLFTFITGLSFLFVLLGKEGVMRRAAVWSSETVLRTSRRTAQRHTSSTGLGASSHLQQRRLLHQPLGLPYDISKGMGGFMSPETLNVVATDYQKGLLDRLNEETKGERALHCLPAL